MQPSLGVDGDGFGIIGAAGFDEENRGMRSATG